MSASAAGAGLVCLGGIGPALAIPSPELVVGSFTSISQIFALASALLGGGAAVATFRMRARGGAPGLSRRFAAFAIAAVVLLIASVASNVYQFVGARAERLARLQDTLLRQATTPGGPKLDPKNLELSYADMVKQPTGITTEEAAKLLDAAARGERDDLIFIDPPYAQARDWGTELSVVVAPLLSTAARVIVESDRRAPLKLEMPVERERRYGDTTIRIHSHQ